MTDTQRTATEQLLISGAVDHAVSQLDFRILAGKTVFFDAQYLDGTVDRGYVVSSLRQHLLASGCVLQEDRAKATYIVEARSGGVGTDRHSLLVGVPQMNVPSLMPGQPTSIPEIPFARKTDQNGVAKIAVFAYNRQSGQPVWQSGVVMSLSSARDIWLLGAGPFQKGTIRNGTEFAGQPLPPLPLPSFRDATEEDRPLPPVVSVTQGATWSEPPAGAAAPRTTAVALPEVRGRLPKDRPTPLGALIRAHLADAPSKAAPPAPPKPAPPPTPNSGGQAETEPKKVLSSALGCSQDG
jgi:hypothetical protein